jgi:4-hydroxybenzoate polyprenyltransferase
MIRHKLSATWQAMHAFLHIPALFLTLMLPLLGTAGVTARLTVPRLLALLGIGIAFHIYAYVLNDFIDLPVDRTQPSRSNDPLVRGIVQPRQALLIALAQIPVALALALSIRGNSLALLVLGAAFVFMGIYDIWGKRCFFPPLTDLSQGLAWAMLALFGAMVFRPGPPPAITRMLCAFIVVFFVMSNGVHGSLKDLKNDLRCQRRTTALFLGARPGEHGITLSPLLKLYALLLQTLLIGLLLVPLIANSPGYGQPAWRLLLATVAALVFLSLAWPAWIVRMKREKAQYIYAGVLHLGLLLIGLLMICAPLLQPMALALLIAVYLLPLFSVQPLRQRIAGRWSRLTIHSRRLIKGSIEQGE